MSRGDTGHPLRAPTPPCSVAGGLRAFCGFLEKMGSSPSSAFVGKEGVETQEIARDLPKDTQAVRGRARI